MIRIVNIGEEEKNQGWKVKNEPFFALWNDIEQKDMFIACTEKALTDVVDRKENVINNCILIRNKKGSLIIEKNPKEQWCDSIVLSVNAPEGYTIDTVNFVKRESNLIDVLYYKMSKDKTQLAMVLNIPSIVGKLASSRDLIDNIVLMQMVKQDNPELIDTICVNATNGQITIDKEEKKLESRLQPVQSINRKALLVVPDEMTMENIIKCKQYNKLAVFKTIRYSELEEYFKTVDYTYFDIYMIKNIKDDMTALGKLQKVLRENKKNARICLRQSNRVIYLSRIY